MTVTDEAKLFAIRQQLIQAQRGIDAATRIIDYVFERVESPSRVVGRSGTVCDNASVSYPVDKYITAEEKECSD